MRLNYKVLTILGISWFCFITMTYFVANIYLANNFLELEKQVMNKNIKRVSQALDVAISAVSIFNTDWAVWDLAHRYMADKSPEFTGENISLETFKNSGLRLILYVTLDNKIKASFAVNPESTQFIPYTGYIDQYICKNCTLVNHKLPDDKLKGLIGFDDKIMLVASHGITSTDKTKDINGFMISGIFFTANVLNKLAETTELNLKLYFRADLSKNQQANNVFQDLVNTNQTSMIINHNKQIASAYLMLNDINQKPIGMLQIIMKRDIFISGQRALKYFLLSFIIAAIVFGLLIAGALHHFILKRVENLNTQIKKISRNKDYSLRITSTVQDEITSVANHINEMIKTIQKSQTDLNNQIQQLSQSKIELQALNQSLVHEIKKREEAENEMSILNDKLIIASRKAGMADAVSSILHNVGNVFNSINVSIDLISDQLSKQQFAKLFHLRTILESHLNDLNNYLMNDENGKILPAYLVDLLAQIEHIYHAMETESASLVESVKHAKDVLNIQRSNSVDSVIQEKIQADDLLRIGFKMCGDAFDNTGIEITQNIQTKSPIISDKSKLLQILVNLLLNARDSVTQSPITPKKIEVIVNSDEIEQQLSIIIIDNGVGINAENIHRIFSLGFTTKINGHGFGLHSSALAAKELGGMLTVSSGGEGKGASFQLILPLHGISTTKSIHETAEK